jgi:pimeloyl-ACP methyl ester carboxylesterase
MAVTPDRLAPSAATLAFGQAPMLNAVARTLRCVDRLSPKLATTLALQLFYTPVPSKVGQRKQPAAPWRLRHIDSGADRVALLSRAAITRRTSNPKILLVHGWAGNSLQMEPLGTAVATEGFDAVLLDFPAHGRSAGWRCTMPQMVQSLFAAEAQAGPFHAVIAHSMGSIASMHAISRGLKAERLVVLAPSASPTTVLQWFCDLVNASETLYAGMRADMEQRMALHEYEAEWFGRCVEVPTLVVHDPDDRMTSLTNGLALAEALPRARMQVTQGLSHRRILTDLGVALSVLAHVTGDAVDALGQRRSRDGM